MHRININSGSDTSTDESAASGRDKRYKWSYRRYAWEFLCLNEKFRAACDGAPSLEEKKKIAAKYGLKEFKPYDEPYNTTNKPEFGSAQISSWTKSKENDLGGMVSLELRDGEVAILFDLDVIFLNKKSLAAQIQHASRRLEKELQNMIADRGEEPKIQSVKRDRLDLLLDVAKNLFEKLPADEIKTLHFEKHLNEYVIRNNYHKFVNRQMKLAKEFVESKYLALAAELPPNKNASDDTLPDSGRMIASEDK
jgi:hypothetical protein